MTSTYIVSQSEEAGFIEAVRASAHALLENVPGKSGEAALESSSISKPQHQAQAEMQRILALALDEKAGSYSGIYSLMHEYSNSVAAGVAFNENKEIVPVTFSVFEVVFRYSSADTQSRVAEIPPKPYIFCKP